MIFVAARQASIGGIVGYVLASIVVLICWAGLFMVHPNEAKVLQLFGKYVGTCHDPGLRWANPSYTKTSVSVRVRNFEIAAVVELDEERKAAMVSNLLVVLCSDEAAQPVLNTSSLYT